MPNDKSLQAAMNKIFVFGSNEKGRHGKGAALHARNYYGAVYGVGNGPQGMAYAIPTKSGTLVTLSLDKISGYVDMFKAYAKNNPDCLFMVTQIGCGLAGYEPKDIAPLFVGSPSNCVFDEEWKNYLPGYQTFKDHV